MEKDFSNGSPELSEEQKKKVSALTKSDIREIDDILYKNTSSTWRKVARVVGCAMSDFDNKYSGIPDVYFAQRVIELVNRGQLKSQGNLNHMRFSEVKRA